MQNNRVLKRWIFGKKLAKRIFFVSLHLELGSWITNEKHHEKPANNVFYKPLKLKVNYGRKILSGG